VNTLQEQTIMIDPTDAEHRARRGRAVRLGARVKESGIPRIDADQFDAPEGAAARSAAFGDLREIP
jgi:hypothetical protein